MKQLVYLTVLVAASFQAGADLVINEIDYDQPGIDTAEFIEIRNIGPSYVNLADYSLQLVNGKDSKAVIYNTINLPSVDLAPGDYFVVCGNLSTVINCDLDANPDIDLIQNGAPDAIGLRNNTNGVLVDTVSYEGDTIGGYTETSGEGLLDNPDFADYGLSRRPVDDGVPIDTDNNSLDFVFQNSTPGIDNIVFFSSDIILLDGFEASD